MPVPALVVPTDNVDDVTSASIFNEMQKPVDTLNDHMAGVTTHGASRHNDTHVDVTTLDETTTPVQSPANQHAYNDGTYKALSNWLGGFAGSTFIAKAAAAAAAMTVKAMLDLLQSHSHADATHGGQLAQANTHQSADTDVGASSLHHTLGTGATQAAAGNHTHANMEVTTNKNVNSGYAGLDGSGKLATTVLPTASAVSAAAWSVGSATTAGSASTATTATTANGVAANAVGTAGIVDGAVTSAKIADGTIVSADIAADTITASNIAPNAIGSSELADGAVDTAAIVDANVTTAKIADAAITTAKIVDANVTTAKIADAAITTAKIVDASVSQAKILEGAIIPNGGLHIYVNPLKKWNDSGTPVHWDGGDLDLTAYVPGAGLRRYVLIEVNSTAAVYAKAGAPTSGALADTDRPSKDPDTTPLGFVALQAGQVTIATSDITAWRGPGEAGGVTGSGSPIGHVHGAGSEARVAAIGMDEGFPHPTASASMSILVEGIHYRSTAGLGVFKAQTVVGPLSVPASNQRIDAIYLDPATGAYVIVQGVADPTNPAKPAFSGGQRGICYVHMRSTMSVIKAGDDTVNGWIEDARQWIPGSGVSSVPVGVSEGGTGQTSFAAAGLVYATGTTPFSIISASATATLGLGFTPTITPGSSDASVVQIGGGTVATGTTNFTNLYGLDVQPSSKTGTGTITNRWAARFATGAISTNDYGIQVVGNSRFGSTAAPAAVVDIVAPAVGTVPLKSANMVGQTADIAQFDGSAVTNGQASRVDKNGHLYTAQASSPIASASTGAGTGGAITLTGTDQCGILQVVTGTAPAGTNSLLGTITFRNAWTVAPKILLLPYDGNVNINAHNLARNQDIAQGATTTTTSQLVTGGTALAASTTYQWIYFCFT